MLRMSKVKKHIKLLYINISKPDSDVYCALLPKTLMHGYETKVI